MSELHKIIKTVLSSYCGHSFVTQRTISGLPTSSQIFVCPEYMANKIATEIAEKFEDALPVRK